MIVRRFGPTIAGTWTAPEAPVAGTPDPVTGAVPLPDPVVEATISNVVASATAGEIDLTVAFAIPSYDPTQFNQVVQVTALNFPAGHNIPTDPNLAAAESVPQAFSTTHSLFSGQTVSVTVVGCQEGDSTIVTLIDYMEPDPVTPTVPTAAATPSATVAASSTVTAPVVGTPSAS